MAATATKTLRVTLPIKASAYLARRAKMENKTISNVILSFIVESGGTLDETENSHPLKTANENDEMEAILDERSKKFEEFLAFARANPVFEKGYKFNREECYDRKIFRR